MLRLMNVLAANFCDLSRSLLSICVSMKFFSVLESNSLYLMKECRNRAKPLYSMSITLLS